MRTYLFMAERPGGCMNWPGRQVESTARIGAVVITLFRNWFGSVPHQHWHEDGFLAEAWDRRGNRITVEQYNKDTIEHLAKSREAHETLEKAVRARRAALEVLS